jgi:hypothetical protein
MSYDTEAEVADNLADPMETADVVEDDSDDMVALKIKRSDV